MTQEPVLLTTAEVARKLRVDPATVRRWCLDGLIEHVRLPGGVYRFHADDIARLTERVAS